MNYDTMTNAPPKDVAQATMRLVDKLQHSPAAIQSVAAAALFLTVCKVHRLAPQDVFTVTGNMMADTIHGERTEFKALRLYAEHELK
jgi:hypothetical protein